MNMAVEKRFGCWIDPTGSSIQTLLPILRSSCSPFPFKWPTSVVNLESWHFTIKRIFVLFFFYKKKIVHSNFPAPWRTVVADWSWNNRSRTVTVGPRESRMMMMMMMHYFLEFFLFIIIFIWISPDCAGWVLARRARQKWRRSRSNEAAIGAALNTAVAGFL